MSKHDQLWKYFQADQAYEQSENELKNTDRRRALLKLQKYIQDNQRALKGIESETLVRQNELSELLTQVEKMTKQLSDGREEIASMRDDDLSEVDGEYVKELIADHEAIFDAINKYKKQIAAVKGFLDKSEEDVKRIVINMQKAKKQFDSLKETYDAEVAEGVPALNSQKAELDALAKTVDQAMLNRYRQIKKNRKDPVALVVDGRCSGCKMALPSGNILKVGDKTLECENCGRMLISISQE